MKKYVLGFLFNEDLTEVVMIEKNHPNWQKGLYNGLGGQIEDGETALEAMRREFKEECGLDIKDEEWQTVVQMGSGPTNTNDRWFVDVFTAKTYNWTFTDATTTTDEKVVRINLQNPQVPPEKFIDNIDWLIAMSKNVLRGGLKYSLFR